MNQFLESMMENDGMRLSSNLLELLYQDAEIIAVNKPAGMLVHRSKIDIRAREFALQKLRDQIGRPVFLAHRLDRPTSGVLLFALNKSMATELSRLFEYRQIKKTYLAIVRGHPPDQGHWDEPLIEKRDRVSDAMADPEKLPQPATTQFQTIERWEVPFSAGKYPTSRYAEVEIVPLTGRKHQIRRHFNHMSYPIIGDTTHGDRRHNRLFKERFKVSRLLLIANSIGFCHPATGKKIEITATDDAEYKKAKFSLSLNRDHLSNFGYQK